MKRFPKEFIDENLRTDYAKIGSIIVTCGEPERLIPHIKDILSKETIFAPLVADGQNIRGPWELISWFYYLGLLSISGSEFRNLLFPVPNMYARTGLEKVLSCVIVPATKGIDFNRKERIARKDRNLPCIL